MKYADVHLFCDPVVTVT